MSFCRHSMTLSTVVVFLLFVSCEKRITQPHVHYPIDSLIDAQIRLLVQAKASAFKNVSLKGKKDTVTLKVIDSTGWTNELGVFRELKTINKPVNVDAYSIQQLEDTRSNLRIKSITTNQDLPVRSLKIYYQDREEKVRRIEAEFNEDNSLYGSTRVLVLEFQDVRNQPMLSSYFIEGDQKIFLGDSVSFRVKGTVSLPRL